MSKPWLATFFLGLLVFIVGLYFQRVEKAKRNRRGRERISKAEGRE